MAVEDQAVGGGFLGNLPPNARLAIIIGGVIILVGLLMFMFMGGSDKEKDDGYRTIYKNLPLAEAGNAKDLLEMQYRIPVKLADQGTTIRVPKDKAEDALVKLAQKNMPSSGQIGYEIFDKGSFISTDFEKKVSLQRAMNGELARLVKRFDGVEDARVNIVVPEPALFSEEQMPTTASVLVEFSGGGGFKPESVEAITHLIASAVPGLKPGNVTVVDSNGMMLAAGQEGLNGENDTRRFNKQLADQIKLQREMEQRLENKIITMLERVLGPGRVRATVTGTFDFNRVQRRNHKQEPVVFDDGKGKKELTVTARRSSNEKSVNGAGGSSSGTTTGSVGAANNSSGASLSSTTSTPTGGGAAAGTSTSERGNTQETYNYNRTEELVTAQTGILVNKSVSVQFEIPKKKAGAEGAEGGEEGAEGAGPKITVEAVQKMVEKAVNYNEKEGDKLDVQQVTFDTTVYDKLKEEMEKARQGTPMWVFILIGLGGLVVGAGIGGALLGKKKAAPTDQFGAMPGAPQFAAIPAPGAEGAAPPPPGGAIPAPQAQEVTRAPIMPLTPDNPFGFLQGVTPQTVAQLLSTERLPTLVAVLAQLEPGQAEDVITLLNPEIQNEVRTRLAQNPVLPPMTQKMVSQSLKKRLAAMSSGVA